ncbi:hypothetical protein F5Y17DRAFT_359843 [Xylariaceae sp. FL0594]|nr:hypothetical protein F5Y17DRAFT_359843 [Xylariaceae sp. FL0594]
MSIVQTPKPTPSDPSHLHDPFSGFTRLSPHISLLEPEEAKPGELVVICSWTGARPRHIARYISLYRTTITGTSARLLLVETPPGILVSSYARQRAHSRPAVDYILKFLHDVKTAKAQDGGGDENGKLKIMLHILSSGGSLTATQLLLALRAERGEPLPIAGMILDSAPDGGSYIQTHRAFVLSLPSSRRRLGSVVGHMVLGPIWARYALGQENSQIEMRRVLLDQEHLCAAAKSQTCPRLLYVYSKKDEMTLWRDVEAHAATARHLGWKVKEIVCEDSAHCSHFSSHPETYSKAVKALWNTGLRGDWEL